MKRILIPALLILCVWSCKKDKADGIQDQLKGTWELRTTGGDYSSLFITYPAGNGNTLTFSGGNHYSRTDITDNDTTNSSGTYTITKGSTCISNDVSFIRFSDGSTSDSSVLKISSDTLNLDANTCVVAYKLNHTYIKIK